MYYLLHFPPLNNLTLYDSLGTFSTNLLWLWLNLPLMAHACSSSPTTSTHWSLLAHDKNSSPLAGCCARLASYWWDIITCSGWSSNLTSSSGTGSQRQCRTGSDQDTGQGSRNVVPIHHNFLSKLVIVQMTHLSHTLLYELLPTAHSSLCLQVTVKVVCSHVLIIYFEVH